MSNESVIKEFLIGLGFKTDESSMQKFKTGIDDITKGVMRLAGEVTAATTAIVYGVARWANNLESLYFAARRTGSSANELKAFGVAAQNFGIDIDEALSSVEGLASFLRTNPGGTSLIGGWLKQIGLSATDATGHAKGAVELVRELGLLFAHQREHGQYFLANQEAGMIGISERTALAMSQPGFNSELEKQERRAKGWDAISAAAHRFEVQLRNLKMRFEQLMLGFMGPAMGALQHLMGSFSTLLAHHGKQLVNDLVIAFDFVLAKLGQLLDWIDRNGNRIQSEITSMFAAFKTSYDIVKPALTWVYDELVKLDRATGGWSTRLLALTAVLKLLGAGGIVSGIATMGVGLAQGMRQFLGWAGGVQIGAGMSAWEVAGSTFGVAAAAAIGAAVGTLIYHSLPESMQRKIGDVEGGAVDWLKNAGAETKAWWDGQVAKARDFYALQPFDLSAIQARRIGGNSLQAHTSFNVTVNGTGNLDAVELSRNLKRMIVDAHSGLVREFAATVK